MLNRIKLIALIKVPQFFSFSLSPYSIFFRADCNDAFIRRRSLNGSHWTTLIGKTLNMKLNNLTTLGHNKWQTCESTKRKHRPLKCCTTSSEQCRRLNLVKLCNYILISCVLLVRIINGSDASFGCSSNPCVFGVCIDDLNR